MTLETTGQRHTKITKMKRCGGKSGCGKWKPVETFSRHPNNKDGRQSSCKQCSIAIQAAERLTPQGRAGSLWRSARKRTKKTGLPLTITKEWIIERLERGVSELTGMPFVLEPHDWYYTHPAAPSLDQKEAGKGYTPENTMLTCTAENQLMNQYSIEIVRVYCQAFLNATQGEEA